MGYVTDFYLDDNRKMVLPSDFFNDNNEPKVNIKLNELLKEKDELSGLSEDVITLKQYKRLKNLEKEISLLDTNDENFSLTYKNKYGYDCLESNSFSDIEIFLDENRENGFALIRKKNSIFVYTSGYEGMIVFEKTNNGFVLKELDGTKSNNGWVQEKIEDLIVKFELTVTIKDGGNEEDGFLNEDGIDDENLIKDIIYVNGNKNI